MLRRPRLAWTLVFVAVLAVYFPALRGGFVWNDADYVTRPELRSLAGLGRIWFQPGATEQYYPVLHTAFWIEHRFWGDAPLGYHLLNALLHALAACLFVLVLQRLWSGGPGAGAAWATPAAWLAGLIFALHPVCVESVAWISEQKNTLSLVFYLSAALVYLDFNPVWGEEGAPASRPRSWSRYFVALLLFLLALLSKSVTATLPAALLVVLWWRRGRLSWKRDVGPLLPWFVLAAAAGLFTAWVEKTLIGAQGAEFVLGPVQRGLVAGRVIWFYLGKLVWPAPLIFIYPRWHVDPAAAGQYLFPLGVLGGLAVLWGLRRRARGPLAAALLFIGSLFPILGFFNIYAFIFSFVADHFQYLACLGVIALAASSWRWSPSAPIVARILATAVLATLAVLTWRQCRQYRDVVTFYQTIVARNPDSWLARNNLGDELLARGHPQEAAAQFSEAARLRPGDARMQCNLGVALMDQGKLAEAVVHYQAALRIDPDDVEAHSNLGNVLAQTGRIPEAIQQYDAALRINPDYADAQYNLANVLAHSGRLPEALGHFEAALRLRPRSVDVLNNLGNAYLRLGRLPEAISRYEQALQIDPQDANVRRNLAIAQRDR
jgi:tetratricopeptide (TPR) repeat protein